MILIKSSFSGVMGTESVREVARGWGVRTLGAWIPCEQLALWRNLLVNAAETWKHGGRKNMKQRDFYGLAHQVIRRKSFCLFRKERYDYHVLTEERGLLCPKSHLRGQVS